MALTTITADAPAKAEGQARAEAGGPAVLIVNYRTPALVIENLAALATERATALPGLRAVVVDGASGDGSPQAIARAIAEQGFGDWVTLLPLDVNGGFAYANNQAILALEQAGTPADTLILVNPDARVRPGALGAMLALLDSRPRAGAVGGLLELEDGTPQGCAFHFPSLRREFVAGAHIDRLRTLLRLPPTVVTSATALRVPWVTGAAVAFRRAALEEVGLFDDGFFLYFEETELMHRMARAGWEIWHEPAAHIVHHGGMATGMRDPETGNMRPTRLPRYWYESRRRYFVRTGGRARALLAGLCWLAGSGLFRLRRLCTGQPDERPAHAVADFVAFSLWPRRADRRRVPLPRLGDRPGQPPAWMAPR